MGGLRPGSSRRDNVRHCVEMLFPLIKPPCQSLVRTVRKSSSGCAAAVSELGISPHGRQHAAEAELDVFHEQRSASRYLESAKKTGQPACGTLGGLLQQALLKEATRVSVPESVCRRQGDVEFFVVELWSAPTDY